MSSTLGASSRADGDAAWVRRAGCLLGLAILAAYANSFQAGLTLDNALIIGKDPRLWLPWKEAWPKIVGESYWWPTAPSDLYRPLTTLSYRFNYLALGGALRPGGYHWVNFLLHWLNATLLLGWVRRCGGSRRWAILAAGVFALHPVAVESVTNLVGRADLLATACFLLGLHCHVSAVRAEAVWVRRRWQAALSAVAVLGVLCKESGLTLLGAVWLYDGIFRPAVPGAFSAEEGRLRSVGWGLRSIPPFAPMLSVFALERWRLPAVRAIHWQIFVDNPLARTDFIQRLLTAAKVQADYLGLLVWPAHLTCDYSYNQVPLFGTAGFWSDLGAAAGAILIVLLAGAAWLGRRRHPWAAFAVLLYFGLSLPTANVFKVIGSIMAERFLYLPLLGFALMAGLALDAFVAALERRLGTWGRGRWAVFPAILLFLACAWRVRVRNRDWRDDYSLWQSAVRVAPDSFKTHKGFASALVERDPSERGLDAAIAEGEKALAILDGPDIDPYPERRDTTLFIALGKFYCLKADCCAARGDLAQAALNGKKGARLLDRALNVLTWVNQELRRIDLVDGIRPEEVEPAQNLDLYRSLALALHRIGRNPEAARFAELAIWCDPFDVEGRQFIAACLEAQHEPQQAAVYDHMALLLDAQFRPAWEDLQRIYRPLYPDRNPVRILGMGDYQIDVANPAVIQGVAEAAIELDRFFRHLGLAAAADRARSVAVTRFHCSPDVFAVVDRRLASLSRP